MIYESYEGKGEGHLQFSQQVNHNRHCRQKSSNLKRLNAKKKTIP